MICLTNTVEELILRLLNNGDNNLTSFRNRLFFLSNETLSSTLINLNNKGIIIINIKENNIYFKDKYFKIIQFLEKTNFVTGIKNYITNNSRVNNLLFSLLKQSGVLKELNESKENIDIQKALVSCLNCYYKDSFYKEVATLKIRYNFGDKNNGK